jgi:hypothetical protein
LNIAFPSQEQLNKQQQLQIFTHGKQRKSRDIICVVSLFIISDNNLKTTTATSTLAACAIGRNGGDILNSSNLHSISSQCSESGLGSRSWTATLVSSSSTDLDVQGSDTEFLAFKSDILGGKHGCVRRRLVAIGLDLHTSGNTDNGFSARKISNVDKSIIEGSKQVSDAKDFVSL